MNNFYFTMATADSIQQTPQQLADDAARAVLDSDVTQALVSSLEGKAQSINDVGATIQSTIGDARSPEAVQAAIAQLKDALGEDVIAQVGEFGELMRQEAEKRGLSPDVVNAAVVQQIAERQSTEELETQQQENGRQQNPSQQQAREREEQQANEQDQLLKNLPGEMGQMVALLMAFLEFANQTSEQSPTQTAQETGTPDQSITQAADQPSISPVIPENAASDRSMQQETIIVQDVNVSELSEEQLAALNIDELGLDLSEFQSLDSQSFGTGLLTDSSFGTGLWNESIGASPEALTKEGADFDALLNGSDLNLNVDFNAQNIASIDDATLASVPTIADGLNIGRG